MHDTAFVHQFGRLSSGSTRDNRRRTRVFSFCFASNGLVVNFFRCQRRGAVRQDGADEAHSRPFRRYLPDVEGHKERAGGVGGSDELPDSERASDSRDGTDLCISIKGNGYREYVAAL